jgi:hypothetical protein
MRILIIQGLISVKMQKGLGETQWRAAELGGAMFNRSCLKVHPRADFFKFSLTVEVFFSNAAGLGSGPAVVAGLAGIIKP